MGAGICVVTGTDTGVCKTVLTVLLTRRLRAQGRSVLAVKPFCSGGRMDARFLRQAQGGALSLDEINPWHFRAPFAPLLAARRQGVRVRLRQVLVYVRRMQARCQDLLVEGAGGLLSPLGVDCDARAVIGALKARTLVVCPNRLGAVNQALLVLAALPQGATRRAHVVLVAQPKPDSSARSNRELLAERLGCGRVHLLPCVSRAEIAGQRQLRPSVLAALDILGRVLDG
jgi:dethiobiotin synthetase